MSDHGAGVDMYFNVSQLLREPSGSARSFEINKAVSLERGVESLHFDGTVRLLRTDMGIWVSAMLDSEALCTCSRCLDDFRQPVRMRIEEEYFPQGEPDAVGASSSVDYPEDICRIGQDHTLDLTELAKQYYSLCLPMKPVCRADCKGLCGTCGANLNDTPCGCQQVSRDIRWGPLLELASLIEQNEGRR